MCTTHYLEWPQTVATLYGFCNTLNVVWPLCGTKSHLEIFSLPHSMNCSLYFSLPHREQSVFHRHTLCSECLWTTVLLWIVWSGWTALDWTIISFNTCWVLLARSVHICACVWAHCLFWPVCWPLPCICIRLVHYHITSPTLEFWYDEEWTAPSGQC